MTRSPEPAPFRLLGSALPSPAPPLAWVPLADGGLPTIDAGTLRASWTHLHAGQADPVPCSPELLEAWVLYHNGRFAEAAAAGLALDDPGGLALANQATAIYANYVEPREAMRLALFRQVAERAHVRLLAAPDDVPALYWHSYSLGRHAQAVSVARTLAQGLGGRLKATLENLLALQPRHADAHFALGVFYSEVIDKVGPLVGRMTYGVRADAAEALFEQGLALHPDSATGLMEYARALLALHGQSRLPEATRLYERAAALEPLDARQSLDVALARAGLRD